MAGFKNKKRSHDGNSHSAPKKQKRKQQYHSDSEEEPAADFDAVNLLDSDDDIHNARVDAVEASDNDSVDSYSSLEDEAPKKKQKVGGAKKQKAPKRAADSEEEDDDSELEEGSDGEGVKTKSKSKRNDPAAFATSLSKILSTKLSTSKRADPVLARSAAAHEASKAAVDTALEAKAKKQLRNEKRAAMEKGRVRDVLIATKNEGAEEPETTTAEILETERRLRKVAQRGVVKLFNAVRAAQVKAAEAEKDVRKAGVIGVNRREEKVNELSKKGFLELIASGGGGLKKGAIEEA